MLKTLKNKQKGLVILWIGSNLTVIRLMVLEISQVDDGRMTDARTTDARAITVALLCGSTK